MKNSINNQPFFCSWSGGKDSCLALYHAIQAGGKPKYLLTVMAEDGMKSRSHGLPKALLEEQARSLGIPIIFRSASWGHYEEVFVSVLREFKEDGIKTGVFGDIDIDSHREWVRRVCGLVDVTPVHSLWQRERQELLYEFISLGFKATIIVVQDDKLDKKFLGKMISRETISELKNAGVDASGELGEYHTVVLAGPIFSADILFVVKDKVLHEGYWFLEIDSNKIL